MATKFIEPTKQANPNKIQLNRIRFRGFKALESMQVGLRVRNILTGPNNSGKSTVIASLRLLDAGLRRGAARRIESVLIEGKRRSGYIVGVKDLPLSLENYSTNYSGQSCTIEYVFSNGNSITLYFSDNERVQMTCFVGGALLTTPTSFKRAFPYRIGVVPTLGPFDREERILEPSTLRNGLHSHRASSHFRNYWRANQELFGEFAQLLASSWPGMEVKLPILETSAGVRLQMMCLEDRTPRELYWTGFGFQVWCQLLTHYTRCKDMDLFVVDEPETYLHPSVQRQFLHILEDSDLPFVMATHSSEIINEASATDVILIERGKGRARRLQGASNSAEALSILGSNQNVVLGILSRTLKGLFVEGQDLFLLTKFAKTLELKNLGGSQRFAPLETGGFDGWTAAKGASQILRKSVSQKLQFGILLDRDYRADSEVDSIVEKLEGSFKFVHILYRKEIENYLICVPALYRLVAKQLAKKGLPHPSLESIENLVDLAIEDQAEWVEASFQEARTMSGSAGIAPLTKIIESKKQFRRVWGSNQGRLRLIPGKAVLSGINRRLQESFRVSITTKALASEIQADELPSEFCDALTRLDASLGD